MDQLGGRLLHRAALFHSPSFLLSDFLSFLCRDPSAYFFLSLSFSLPFRRSSPSFALDVTTVRTVVIEDRTALFLQCTRRAARDVAWDFFLSRLDMSTRGGRGGGSEEEEDGGKRRKGRRERSVRLLGALVKSGEINSLRERRQS